MNSISSINSQIPIPPSVNDSVNDASSELNTQKNIAQVTNTGAAASNVIGGINAGVKGILNNLVVDPPITKNRN